MVLGLLVGLLSAEAVLRTAGYEPWRYHGKDAREPTMYAPDPVLGWRGIPGAWVIPPYSAGSPPIRVTLWEDGSRATALSPVTAGTPLLVIGGSVSQGWGVSDEHTYAWKLQEQFPGRMVRNAAAPAYGTVQAMLSLVERSVAGGDVVYGFIDGHEMRNVASPVWLRTLALYSRRGHVATPWADLGADGELRLHSPVGFSRWPLRESFASVRILEFEMAKVLAGRRAANAGPVTRRLLQRLDDRVRGKGAELLVALLHFAGDGKSELIEFLRREEIAFVDCARELPPELQVPGEGHPGATLHSYWAGCISVALGS